MRDVVLSFLSISKRTQENNDFYILKHEKYNCLQLYCLPNLLQSRESSFLCNLSLINVHN